jgi:hypothetical protein
MYVKLQRLLRTPRSEKLALLDLDEHDEQEQPINFGLLHLHYLEEEVRGTMLLAPAYWARITQGLRDTTLMPGLVASLGPFHLERFTDDASSAGQEELLVAVVDYIMREVCAPVGVSSACRIQIAFAPPAQRQFVTNSPRLQAQEHPDAPTDDDQPVRPRGLFGA